MCFFFHAQKDDQAHSVGQNIFFKIGSAADPHWKPKAMRSWFLQGNLINATIWNDYVHGLVTLDSVKSFTQLMWATSEFVGCAAAQ